MYRMADDFYTSLGFDPMPHTFWEKSMIVKPDHNVVCHPLAWNFFKGDVRLAITAYKLNVIKEQIPSLTSIFSLTAF